MENEKNMANKILNEPYILSEAQKNAVISEKRNIKIIAGAGAGKTETLSRKIIYLLLVEKIEPKYIVAFTFTDRAAESLKNRVYNTAVYFNAYEILNHLGEMYIGTIHSYAKRILEDYFDYGNYNILNENQEIAFLLKNRNRLQITSYEKNITKSVLDFHRTVNMVFDEYLDQESLKKDATEFYIKFKNYLNLLKDNKLVTFGNLIYDLVNKLKENEEKIKEIHVKYLFIDEFQDINYLQYYLIKLLSKYSNIIAVGDTRQTIYQWRGSNYKFFDEFSNEFNDVQTIVIPENRRSLKNIVINANEFVKSFKDSNYNDMQYINNDNGSLILGKFDDYNDEAKNIAKTILKLKNDNIIKKYSDISILMRSVRNYSDKIIMELKNNNIPYIIGGKTGLFKRDEALVLAMIFSWFSEHDTFKYNNIKLNGEDILKCAFKKWSEITNIGEYNNFIKSMYDIKNKIYSDKKEEHYKNLTEIFQEVLNILNYKSFEYNKDKIIMANIGRFNELLTDYESANWYGGNNSKMKDIFNGLYWFINAYAFSSYEEQQIDDIIDLDAVQIMTVHQAKGLEWPIVFLTSVCQGIFPSSLIGRKLNWCGIPDNLFDRNRYEGNIEDEKRLFYVAITRPKYNLIVTNYKTKNSKYYNDSDFINNLKLDLFEDYNINNKYYSSDNTKNNDEIDTYSTTDLIKYNQCHYMYLLRNVFGYQPGINEAIGYGNALHFVLKKAADFVKQGYSQDSAIIEAIDEYFHLPFADKKAFNNLSKAAKKLLIDFINKNSDILTNASEMEYRLEFPVEKASIVGKVDILINNEDSGFEIIDYKTDKNVGTFDESFIQINTYVIGLKRLGKNISKGRIAYLTEKELKEVSIDEESQKLSEEEIKSYIKGIKDYNYEPNTKHCRNCDMKKICKYYRVE